MTIAIIGAGISGLVAAARAIELCPGRRVVVIDQAERPGGLLSGRYYSNPELYFDIGTHIYKETGRPEIDRLLRGMVPENELVLMDQQTGDLSGAIYNGRLQANSHFPDIRGHPDLATVAQSLRIQALEASPSPRLDRMRPLLEVSRARFGTSYTDHVVSPILSHVFDRPAEDLAAFSLFLPGITRAILDDADVWHRHESSDSYRALVAYPEQRNLPVPYRHGLGHFYTKPHGSSGVVQSLAQYITKSGVELLMGTTITSVNLDSGHITLKTGEGVKESIFANQIIFATGAIGTARLLGQDLSAVGLDRPMSHWILNLELEASSPSDLCYLYGFDEGCDWYRVTNYAAFSGQPDDRRLTVEVLGDRIGNPENSALQIVQQLYDHGIAGSSKIRFANGFLLKAGFPVPSTRNLQGIQAISGWVRAQIGSKHILCGVGCQNGLFFQNEILVAAYDSVTDMLAL